MRTKCQGVCRRLQKRLIAIRGLDWMPHACQQMELNPCCHWHHTTPSGLAQLSHKLLQPLQHLRPQRRLCVPLQARLVRRAAAACRQCEGGWQAQAHAQTMGHNSTHILYIPCRPNCSK